MITVPVMKELNKIVQKHEKMSVDFPFTANN